MILKPYLIGQITWDPLTWKWRKNIEELSKTLKGIYDIEIINPCNSNMHENIEKSRVENSGMIFHEYVTKAIRRKPLLTPRDKYYVQYSNCCIANLFQYDEKRPLIGTFFELAWYHDSPEKIVIAIHPDPDNDKTGIANHPFILDTVHYYVKNEKDALEALIEVWPRKS
jgi:hypothetical protein